jgi:hypothetical protein
MKITIYCLKDPRNVKIRYIGLTKNPLSIRLSQHMTDSNSNHGTYKKHWIQQLHKLNLKPTIHPIKVLNCTLEEAYLIEQKLIQVYKLKGYKLTNLSDKGVHKSIKCYTRPKIAREVLQYSLEGVFITQYNSISEAAEKVQGTLKGIWKALNGRRSAFGYQWQYKVTEIVSKTIASIDLNTTPKKWVKVDQYSVESIFIKTWDSITAAKKAVGDGSSNIIAVCKGTQKTCKGFIWKYHNSLN